MKILPFFIYSIFVFSINNLSAWTDDNGKDLIIINRCVVEQTTNSTIYMLEDKDGNIYYEVISKAIISMIPDAVNVACKAITGGNKPFCYVIGKLCKALIDHLKGDTLVSKEGTQDNIQWKASLTQDHGIGSLLVKSLSDAKEAAAEFTRYKNQKTDSFPWEKCSINKYSGFSILNY